MEERNALLKGWVKGVLGADCLLEPASGDASFRRYWRARLDGRPVALEPVDGVILGLEVPGGEHTVELSYLPQGFLPGLLWAVASAVLLGWGVARGRRAPRSGWSAEDLESVSCLLCGSAPPARGGYQLPPFRAVRCPECGFWYLTPRLREASMLDAYRSGEYFEGVTGLGYSSYLAQEPTLRLTFQRALDELARRGLTGGRLLEIGCAYGFFLDEAEGRFAARVGTDFSAEAAERAHGRADRIHLGGLEALENEDPFDLIAVIHVIEHIYDPRTMVASLAEHLRPGGALLLATPDMGGFWRPLLGRFWPFIKTPEHVSFFDRHTLTRLLELEGFVEVETFPYHSVFSFHLVAEKLGLRLPDFARRWNLILPATTAAVIGRRPRGEGTSPAVAP